MANEVSGRVSGNVSTTATVSGNVQAGGSRRPLPPATEETLGGIIVGQDLLVDESGVLSVDKATQADAADERPITAAAVHTEIENVRRDIPDISGLAADIDNIETALVDKADASELDAEATARAAADGEIADELVGVKSAIHDLDERSFSALGAELGQMPVANGHGSWNWESRPASIFVTPIYLGDWVTENLPSACLRIGDMVYLFDGLPLTATTDVCQLHIYNIATNEFVETKNIQSGHANSVAYDEDSIWIAPVHYNSLPEGVGYVLIKYRPDFSEYELVATPVNMMGVSYDWRTHTLYALGYDWKIYRYDSGEFVPITNPIVIESTASFNQDFAIYDGRVYISTPKGIIASGMLGTDTIIDMHFTVSSIDQNARWKMNEIQGFEFTQDGSLYCAKYSFMGNGLSCGFFTQVPIVNTTTPEWIRGISYGEANYTLRYVSGKPLFIGETQIRNLNQLRLLIDHPNRIEVTAPADMGNVTLSSDITLYFTAAITFGNLKVQNELFELFPEGANHSISFSGNFSVERGGTLAIVGDTALNVLDASLSISIGYVYPIIRIRVLPNKPLYIGGVQVKKAGLYLGNGSNCLYNEREIRSGSFSLPNGLSANKVYKITYTFEKPMPTADYTVVINMRTTTSGYDDTSKYHFWVHTTTTAGFSIIAHVGDVGATRYPVIRFVATTYNDSGSSVQEVLT